MSNSQRTFELKFGIERFPAMLYALSLAQCTAMMCAGRGEGSVHHAFDEQYHALAAQLGGDGSAEAGRRAVPDEYDWWSVCAAVRQAKTLHFHEFRWEPSKYNTHRPYKAGRVWVVVDGKSHGLGHGHTVDDVMWPRFREALELLAPVDVVREDDVVCRDVPEDRREGRGWL